jgi:hypothetical protein
MPQTMKSGKIMTRDNNTRLGFILFIDHHSH